MLLARYFMFNQVYCHRVRRACDVHLRDFLLAWLPGGTYPVDPSSHLGMTGVDVTAGIVAAASDPDDPARDPAQRLLGRRHFRVLWSRNREDLERNSEAGQLVFAAAAERFGAEVVRRDRRSPPGAAIDFPVLMRNDRIASARANSSVIDHIPDAALEYVFIDPDLVEKAGSWLRTERDSIIPEDSGGSG